MIFVTGGAGFIGSNFVLEWLARSTEPVLNLDKLTYAGKLANLAGAKDDARHVFVHGDICDAPLVRRLFAQHRPRAVIHLAAETHVDRSIADPASFITTNINGTACLLEVARQYWSALEPRARDAFRFLHVSTDEVYGALGPSEPPFTEASAYAPNSPYAASKAASDHLARAYHRTYGFPVLTTNCSNNYGARQHGEKLIALMIANALADKALPVYGNGLQVRDWLHVDDHCAALRAILDGGDVGEAYNIGGGSEKTNLEVVHTLCDILDQLVPKAQSYRRQLVHVVDRPGHDRRYAVDSSKLERALGWAARETFATGIEKTVQWYLAHARPGHDAYEA